MMRKYLSQFVHDKDAVASSLLILFGISLPLSVATNNILGVLMILFWLYKQEYAFTWRIVRNSKVSMAVLLFIALHAVGLLWTEDMAWGLHMLSKEWKFLLIPIMMTFVKREHIRYYISAFLFSMSISEILSYMVWLEVIPPIHKATVYDPTPFMHHTSYNPFLAFAIYLVGYFIFFDKSLSKTQKTVLGLFFVAMSINMFITGGRAGQVGYIVVVLILFFQFFNTQPFKAILLSVLLLGSVFTIAYYNSKVFHDRMNLVISNIANFKKDKNTSVGLRINFVINTCRMIEANPIFGVGTGDYKNTYIELSNKYSPGTLPTTQPHNMYLLEMSTLGIFGLFGLLYLLYTQLVFAYKEPNHFKSHTGAALPLLFFVLMFSDAYLLGHFTTMLFIYFSSFLYRPDIENNA